MNRSVVIDLQSIVKVIFGMVMGVFVLVVLLLVITIVWLASVVGPFVENSQQALFPVPTPTYVCQNYPADFVGPILPCDTRGGKHEVQRPPTN